MFNQDDIQDIGLQQYEGVNSTITADMANVGSTGKCDYRSCTYQSILRSGLDSNFTTTPPWSNTDYDLSFHHQCQLITKMFSNPNDVFVCVKHLKIHVCDYTGDSNEKMNQHNPPFGMKKLSVSRYRDNCCVTWNDSQTGITRCAYSNREIHSDSPSERFKRYQVFLSRNKPIVETSWWDTALSNADHGGDEEDTRFLSHGVTTSVAQQDKLKAKQLVASFTNKEVYTSMLQQYLTDECRNLSMAADGRPMNIYKFLHNDDILRDRYLNPCISKTLQVYRKIMLQRYKRHKLRNMSGTKYLQMAYAYLSVIHGEIGRYAELVIKAWNLNNQRKHDFGSGDGGDCGGGKDGSRRACGIRGNKIFIRETIPNACIVGCAIGGISNCSQSHRKLLTDFKNNICLTVSSNYNITVQHLKQHRRREMNTIKQTSTTHQKTSGRKLHLR